MSTPSAALGQQTKGPGTSRRSLLRDATTLLLKYRLRSTAARIAPDVAHSKASLKPARNSAYSCDIPFRAPNPWPPIPAPGK
jgi:hypothetical protein